MPKHMIYYKDWIVLKVRVTDLPDKLVTQGKLYGVLVSNVADTENNF